MTDIATLGLAVDSTEVVQASTALGQLAAAAKPAADATAAATAASDKHALSLRGQRQVLQGAASDLALLGAAYGSTATTLAALYIENAHLLEGFGGFKNAVASIITPTNLLIGGLAAVAVGGYLAYASISASEKALDDTSHAAGITVGQLRDLAAAANFKGIDSTDFLKSMDKFADDVYQAQNRMGSLAEVFRANNVSASTFNDYLEKAADLIKNAASDQQRLQLLQQMGLPATMDWVRFLSQGAEGIRQAAAEATKFGENADAQMVAKAREFDEAWAKTMTNFSTGWKSAFVGATQEISALAYAVQAFYLKLGADPKQLLKSGSQLTQSSANDIYKAVGTAAPFNATTGSTVDKAALQQDIQRQMQIIGPLVQIPSAVDIKKQLKQTLKPKPEKDSDREFVNHRIAA